MLMQIMELLNLIRCNNMQVIWVLHKHLKILLEVYILILIIQLISHVLLALK